jgi:endonuclease-3
VSPGTDPSAVGSTRDAVTPDAVTPDAVTPDAVTPDAGVPDAGVPDVPAPTAPSQPTPSQPAPSQPARRQAGRGKTTRKPSKSRPRRRRDPEAEARAWAKRLARYRPGLVPFVLDSLTTSYGRPAWERRLDPTSELVLTVLTQNSADVNAEKAFEALRAAYPSGGEIEEHRPGAGWGGEGLAPGAPPDWPAVESAPLPELVDVIRPGGLAPQKAPRIQAALRTIREARGDHSLEFLGEMPALEARDWLTGIDGIGKKTASVLLLFCFGTPLMPVDRHVERVSHRIGLIPPKATADDAHDLYLALLEPDQMYETHVLLIRHGRATCHARRPECEACPVRARCRFVDRKAP